MKQCHTCSQKRSGKWTSTSHLALIFSFMSKRIDPGSRRKKIVVRHVASGAGAMHHGQPARNLDILVTSCGMMSEAWGQQEAQTCFSNPMAVIALHVFTPIDVTYQIIHNAFSKVDGLYSISLTCRHTWAQAMATWTG